MPEEDMTKSSPLVSIVTPFYNTDEYLEECILSVLSQSYTHFEYILVDNQSTDGSGAIARRYSEQDQRIRFFLTPEFLGQVQNYNWALRKISPESKYCKIVQADDWIYDDCIREMVRLSEEADDIRLVSSFRLVGDNVRPVESPGSPQIFSGRDICRDQLANNTFYFGSPSTVMYRSSVVRSRVPFYEEGLMHEDTEVCYEILKNSDFGFVRSILSFSRIENESIMAKVRSFKPELLDRLGTVKKFGPEYLTEREHQAVWQQAEREYLRYLGESLVKRRGKKFWDYHEQCLIQIGYSVSQWTIYLNALLWLVSVLVHPVRSLRQLSQRRKRRLRKME